MSAYCPTHDYHGTEDDGLKWHVYTCYAVDGTPLYVGVSDDPRNRLVWHERYSLSCVWYYHCARVDVSPAIRCRHEAHALEVAEIQRLHPAFNKHHNPDPQPWVKPAERHLSYRELPEIRWSEDVAA